MEVSHGLGDSDRYGIGVISAIWWLDAALFKSCLVEFKMGCPNQISIFKSRADHKVVAIGSKEHLLIQNLE